MLGPILAERQKLRHIASPTDPPPLCAINAENGRMDATNTAPCGEEKVERGRRSGGSGSGDFVGADGFDFGPQLEAFPDLIHFHLSESVTPRVADVFEACERKIGSPQRRHGWASATPDMGESEAKTGLHYATAKVGSFKSRVSLFTPRISVDIFHLWKRLRVWGVGLRGGRRTGD